MEMPRFWRDQRTLAVNCIKAQRHVCATKRRSVPYSMTSVAMRPVCRVSLAYQLPIATQRVPFLRCTGFPVWSGFRFFSSGVFFFHSLRLTPLHVLTHYSNITTLLAQVVDLHTTNTLS